MGMLGRFLSILKLDFPDILSLIATAFKASQLLKPSTLRQAPIVFNADDFKTLPDQGEHLPLERLKLETHTLSAHLFLAV